MDLEEYIKQNFSGNKAMFARAYGIQRSSVYYLLKNGARRNTKLHRILKRDGVLF